MFSCCVRTQDDNCLDRLITIIEAAAQIELCESKKFPPIICCGDCADESPALISDDDADDEKSLLQSSGRRKRAVVATAVCLVGV